MNKVRPFIPGSIPISEHLRQGFLIGVDGTQGTFAETSSVPFQKTDLTIAVWIFIKSPLTRRQEIYSDWSSPHQFRIGIEINGQLCFQGRRDVGGESDMMTPCTKSR